jgi:DNA-binding transcriptional LysR family regulator
MPKFYRFNTYKYVDALQKEITYFMAVAETLNISKASEILGIQQSGLSRAVHRLELDLGQKLFQRKSAGMLLTLQGERFYKAVKDTKQRWEENFNLLLNDSDLPTGLIKIGLHPSFGQIFLPSILQNICKQFPYLELEVNDLTSYQITRKILENEIDFGIVISNIKNPEIIQKNIGSDFIASYQSDLKKIPTHFLVSPETQTTHRLLNKYKDLRKIHIKDYELLAKSAVANNSMVALLPHSVAENYLDLKQVSGPLAKAQISLICHKEKLNSKANKKIYDEILLSCLRRGSQKSS